MPAAHITLATRGWAKALLENVGFIDELLVLDSDTAQTNHRKEYKILKQNRFDLAILFPNSFASALLPFLARVPNRIGYNTQGRSLLLTCPVAVPLWKNKRHEIFYYLNLISELAKELEIEFDSTNVVADTSLFLSAEQKLMAQSLLEKSGVHSKDPIVVICPGSTNSRAKRWPARNFALLANQLADKLHANIILVGAKEELEISMQVADDMHHQPIILTGKTSLSQTINVIGISDLVISNDTGPAHISAALNRFTIVIFGPTNPVTTSPFSLNTKLVHAISASPACAPCMLRDCPIDHRCMTWVMHGVVAELAIKILTKIETP